MRSLGGRIGIGIGLLLWAAAVGLALYMALHTNDEKAQAAWISGSIALSTALAGTVAGAISAASTNKQVAARELAARRRANYYSVLDLAKRYLRVRDESRDHWSSYKEPGELSEQSRLAFKQQAWAEHKGAKVLRDELIPAIDKARPDAGARLNPILEALEAGLKTQEADTTPDHGADEVPVDDLRDAIENELDEQQ
jgi:hypothetical protein